MAIHLEDFLDRATIHNCVKGTVSGKIWIFGIEDPIEIELKGNFLRDLAGCSISVINPDPQEIPPGWSGISAMQNGLVGDITASRRIQVLDESLDEETGILSEPVTTIANALLVEWFNEEGQRVAIDSVSMEVAVFDPEWQMSREEEEAQLAENKEAMKRYIDSVAHRNERIGDEGLSGADEEDELRALDEFEWEERLKESDRITDAYLEALDKYRDEFDQEDKVAELMGWDHLAGPESVLFEDEGVFDGFDDEAEEDSEDDETGGDVAGIPDFLVDEDEDEGGFDGAWDDRHPLYERVRKFSLRLHREAQDQGFINVDEGGRPGAVQDVVFSAMELGAKLAGALNGLARDIDPEPGLVVAWLKRGLPIIDRALASCEQATAMSGVSRDWIEGTRREFFEVRDSMLDLIQEYRRQIP